jgi:hypothetical protein
MAKNTKTGFRVLAYFFFPPKHPLVSKNVVIIAIVFIAILKLKFYPNRSFWMKIQRPLVHTRIAVKNGIMERK